MPDAVARLGSVGARASAGAVLPIAGRGLAVRRGGRTLIDGIDIAFDGEGVTAIVGPNGAGKSLLLRLLAGLIAPDAGEVAWAGRAPDRARATRVGVVFQRPVMLRRTALENVAYALKAAGVPRHARRQRALETLAGGRLEHLAASPARVLSGGEQQRLALARALAPQPEALLLDEPTASLDPAATRAIEDVVRTVADRQIKVVMSTHDLGEARRLAGDVVLMHRGRVIEGGPAAAFFDHPQTAEARRFLAGELLD